MKRLIFLCLILFTVSCNDDVYPYELCANQEGSGQWFEELRDGLRKGPSSQHFEIFTARYKGNTVIIVDPCVGCADNLVTVYNCNGDVICLSGGIAGYNTCPDFSTEVTDIVLIDSK